METTQTYWKRKARLVALRWNFAAWLHLFLRFAITVSFAMMGALLISRRAGFKSELLWEIYTGLMLAGTLVCFVAARKRFIGLRDAFVRLDAALGLHNRLTSAFDGVGVWPPETDNTRDGLHWRWLRVLTPLFASVSALLFAAMVPIPVDTLNETHRKEEPLAWNRIETQLEKLKKEDFVKEEAIKNLEEQVGELRKQSPDDWYSHSSLEASDNLREKTDEALRSLQRDLETASNALEATQQNAGLLSESQLQKLGDQFQQSLQGLQFGTLPLNKDLLGKLTNIDPSKLQKLSPQQIANLQNSLKACIGGCSSCLGNGDKGYAAMMTLLSEGSGGRGGGGAARLSQKNDPTQLRTKKTEGLSNDDLSHAAIGDMLGVSKGEHKVDQAKYSGVTAAGAIQSNGAGGEAVWKNEFTPQEREVLERFFK